VIDADRPMNKKILEMYEVKSPVPHRFCDSALPSQLNHPTLYYWASSCMLHCCHTEWRLSQVTVERRNYAANEK